ncbi:MAG: hypothetical protein NC081_11445 [Roseburia sp.]|nr:hypothetical protein [Roseburia sp.]
MADLKCGKVYELARAFIYRNARPLDLARFQYHFEGGGKEAVLRALSYYQNEDGGCGHAIEADCWNPNSNPSHSNAAAEIIREMDYEDSNHPVIQGLLSYFQSGKDFNGKSWAVAVESSRNYPHASWWEPECDSSCHTKYNGTAQIAGFIVRYAPRDSELFQLGLRVIREAIENLMTEPLTDMHTCACYVRMKEYIEKAAIESSVAYDCLSRKLEEAVNRLIERDVEKWKFYGCKPSSFIGSKDSPYYEDNKVLVQQECEYLRATQLEDGSWAIPWSWETYPEEWAVSKNWWKSHCIIINLLYLKEMGYDLSLSCQKGQV